MIHSLLSLPAHACPVMTQDLPVTDFSDLSALVPLSPEVIDRAVQRCEGISDAEQQWQTYLRSLALLGVQQWLEAGGTDLTATVNLAQPPDAAVQVKGFRLGVVPLSTVPDSTVALPSSPGNQAQHLWLLVEVLEELEQVQIRGGLRADQLPQLTNGTSPAGEPMVPLSAFALPPERVLLYLHHLEPALLLPETSPGSVLEPVLNVGRWLNNQLDTVAEAFAWTLMDPLTPAMAMRSPTQELEAILAELKPEGVEVPPRARAAFTDVQAAGLPLRLYGLTWSVFDTGTPEWSLLVFLGPSQGESLPVGMSLQIRQREEVLTVQTLAADTDSTYLYAQVFGSWDEQFTLDVMPPGGTPLTLPSFTFDPDSSNDRTP
ncbi:MAG: DUF1822 family protein [Leptolyngbyaceae cyanobacterium]